MTSNLESEKQIIEQEKEVDKKIDTKQSTKDDRIEMDIIPTSHTEIGISEETKENKDQVDKVTKTELFSEYAAVLNDLFTPGECKYYIEQGEQKGMCHVAELGYRVDYRNNDRLCFKSPELASILFERIKKHIKLIELKDTPDSCNSQGVRYIYGVAGKWEPVKLNYLFRLCKYCPGGHFAPHYDGDYTIDDDHRSFTTLMIYLNDEFENGRTNFVNDDQMLFLDSEKKYTANSQNVYYSLVPKTGSALMFNHHILHEGEQVKSGFKYILRTEIIYERTSKVARSEKEERAFEFLRHAERLEAEKKFGEAVEFYKKAFHLCPELENTC